MVQPITGQLWTSFGESCQINLGQVFLAIKSFAELEKLGQLAEKDVAKVPGAILRRALRKCISEHIGINSNTNSNTVVGVPVSLRRSYVMLAATG